MKLDTSNSGSQAEDEPPAWLRQRRPGPAPFTDRLRSLDAAPRCSASELAHLRYARKLVVSDALILCCTLGLAAVLHILSDPYAADLGWLASTPTGYVVASVILGAFWMLLLALGGSRTRRVVGRGVEEYVNIAMTTLQLFGLIAILALLLNLQVSRSHLILALVLGTVGLMCGRMYWRWVAVRRRKRGRDQASVLVVGELDAAREMAETFAKEPEAGYRVDGICTPLGPVAGGEAISVGGRDIPVVGIDEAIVDAVQRTGVSTVAISCHLQQLEIRKLIWDLDPLGVDLVVAPGLIDIADHRLNMRAVGGMAVLEVSKPQYTQANSLAKRIFDLVFSAVALVLAAPLMILAAVGVWLSGPGPIFYTSERVGLNGATFKMFKFRSMRADADRFAGQLIAASGQQSPMFFKVKNDPRVTPFGRILRKYSVDELPQLLNVLRGDMSIVGPRPQVRREVESYDELVSRRLTVKPGLTGLWQVSGRSDLRPEDAVRLDLHYVENWSPIQDLVIMAKTVKTVLSTDGAY